MYLTRVRFTVVAHMVESCCAERKPKVWHVLWFNEQDECYENQKSQESRSEKIQNQFE